MTVPLCLPLSAYDEAVLDPSVGPPLIMADEIDPKSLDFVDVLQGVDSADAMVSYLINLRRDSGAAVLGLGLDTSALTHVDEGSAVLAESILRECLEPLLSAGLIRLDDVTIVAGLPDEDADTVAIHFEYTNLATRAVDKKRSKRIPLARRNAL